MIKICCEKKGSVAIMTAGPLIDNISEIALCISEIYSKIAQSNMCAAEVFKRGLQSGLSDESPVWEITSADDVRGIAIVIDGNEREKQMWGNANADDHD